MSNERVILAQSLPPAEESAAAQVEKRLPHKGPDCPFTADLILLAQGRLGLEVAGPLDDHLHECADCRIIFKSIEQALSSQPTHPDVHDLPAEPVPPTIPLALLAPAFQGHAAVRELDSVVDHIADLFNTGASAVRLLEQTGLAALPVLTALCKARDRHLLEPASPRQPVLPTVGASFAPCGEQQSLLDLLQQRSQCLRSVTVRQSRDPATGIEAKSSWTERSKYFGCEVAPLLVSLLSRAYYVGVGWGRTVTAAVSGLKRLCESPPPRSLGPLGCVATVGGLVGELKVRAEASSSILASRLAEAMNGDWEQLYTLHGLEAFISFVDTSDEIDMVRKRISRFPNYQAIFGAASQPGLIDQLDAIVTSCGNAHQHNQFWRTELPRLGVSPETLNSLTHGNIGGVLLEREGLDAKDQALFNDIARRWTGITRRHYEQCALRKPGVILLALGNNKADVVLKCVELGLVSELIIDEDLAMALWDKVDPQKLYPRTLEAVLCRHVRLEEAC